MNKQKWLWIFLSLSISLWNVAPAATEVLMGGPGFEIDRLPADPNAAADANSLSEKPKPLSLPPHERGDFELAIEPATEVPAVRYRLLPIQKEMTNRNAEALYEEAFVVLTVTVDPANWNWPQRLAQFRQNPDDTEIDAVLSKCAPAMELLEQASRCRTGSWPKVDPYDNQSFEKALERMNSLACLTAIQARRDIHRQQYEKAAGSLKTGFAMSRQLVTHADLMLALEGAQAACLMLEEIEFWISRPGAPSLYRAMQDLPQPLLTATGVTKYALPAEEWNDRFSSYGSPMEMMMELEARQRSPIDYPTDNLMPVFQRIERWKVLLQFVEALRYTAALNDGRLPDDPGAITETALPLDPVTHNGFYYQIIGDTILLEAPKTGSPVFDMEPMRYRLNLRLIQ